MTLRMVLRIEVKPALSSRYAATAVRATSAAVPNTEPGEQTCLRNLREPLWLSGCPRVMDDAGLSASPSSDGVGAIPEVRPP